MAMNLGKNRARLTRRGLVFVIINVILAVSAWNTAIYVYYIVLAATGAILIVSWFSPRRALALLAAERAAPQAVHRNTRFPMTIRLRNRSRWVPAVYVRIRLCNPLSTQVSLIPAIAPNTEVAVRLTMQMDRRGVYPLPDIELAVSTPFGFIEARRVLRDGSEIVVYPRVRALRTSAFSEIQRLDNAPRRTLGEGGDFFSLRRYVPGDDLRKVAWRPSARANTLLVRELAAEASRDVVLVLDNRRARDSADFEDRFEGAVELAASLAVTLLHRQFNVAVFTLSRTLPLDHSAPHVLKVLDLLARLQPGPPDDPDPFQLVLEQTWLSGVRMLCVSPEEAQWGRTIRAGIRVLDPREVLYA